MTKEDPMSDTAAITLTVDSGVATLTLNRPEAMNAFNAQMSRELIEAFDETDRNDAIRAVVVTGAGKAFSAGADLSEGTAAFEAGTSSGLPQTADGGIDYSHDSIRDPGGLMTLRIFESLKPVIGAINGVSVGIGATVILPMDIRLASTKSRFGFVFTRRGIVPEGASSFFLPRICGISKALEWCCSGRIFTAEEALAIISNFNDMQEACEALVEEGMSRWKEKRPDGRRDDITALAVKLLWTDEHKS